ncbi:hypothetical protein Bca4012_102355 [Brassica carinata]
MLGLTVVSVHTLETVVSISYSLASICICDSSSNCPETKGGRRRFVTGGGSQINEKLYWFGRYMTYGYCAVTSWAIIQMFEHRRTIEIDLAERRGSKPKTSFRDVLRWFGA